LPQRTDAEARHDRIHHSKNTERHSALSVRQHTPKGRIMADILEFKPPPPPPSGPKPPKRIFDDDYVLGFCAEWRICRAQMQMNWAKSELEDMWGHLPSAHIDFAPLERMHQLEFHLSRTQPLTVHCAREMLGVAITILAGVITRRDRRNSLMTSMY
jgi:hypothetical protein